MIKGKYVILLAVFSLIVNMVSVYNFFLGICSLFLLLIVSITQLFVTLVNKANQVNEENRNFAARNFSNYGTQKSTQVVNKIAIIFGLVLVYGLGIFLTVFQLNRRELFSEFLFNYVAISNVQPIAQGLSILGYILFITALIIGTIFCIHNMKNEQVFSGKNNRPAAK